MSSITIRMKHNNSILLQAADSQLQIVDRNYYVAAELLDLNQFEISERIYKCPLKGNSQWVDLSTELGWMNNICWVYPEPKKAYHHIAGWFGFYPSHRQYEINEAP